MNLTEEDRKNLEFLIDAGDVDAARRLCAWGIERLDWLQVPANNADGELDPPEPLVPMPECIERTVRPEVLVTFFPELQDRAFYVREFHDSPKHRCMVRSYPKCCPVAECGRLIGWQFVRECPTHPGASCDEVHPGSMLGDHDDWAVYGSPELCNGGENKNPLKTPMHLFRNEDLRLPPRFWTDTLHEYCNPCMEAVARHDWLQHVLDDIALQHSEEAKALQRFVAGSKEADERWTPFSKERDELAPLVARVKAFYNRPDVTADRDYRAQKGAFFKALMMRDLCEWNRADMGLGGPIADGLNDAQKIVVSTYQLVEAGMQSVARLNAKWREQLVRVWDLMKKAGRWDRAPVDMNTNKLRQFLKTLKPRETVSIPAQRRES